MAVLPRASFNSSAVGYWPTGGHWVELGKISTLRLCLIPILKDSQTAPPWLWLLAQICMSGQGFSALSFALHLSHFSPARLTSSNYLVKFAQRAAACWAFPLHCTYIEINGWLSHINNYIYLLYLQTAHALIFALSVLAKCLNIPFAFQSGHFRLCDYFCNSCHHTIARYSIFRLQTKNTIIIFLRP